MNNNLSASENTSGMSSEAFAHHPGYTRMFAANQLTIGIFLPLRFYQGDMRVLEGQTALVKDIDQRGFASVWVRDVPLYDPSFGDAGQIFDPFTYERDEVRVLKKNRLLIDFSSNGLHQDALTRL